MFPRSLRAALVPLIYSALACRNDAAAEQRTEAAVPAVTVVADSTSKPSLITANGNIEARASVDLAFQVPGTLMHVTVEEGDRVEAGQVIAVLDPTDYALSFEQAKLVYIKAAQDAQRARIMRAADITLPPEAYEEVMGVEAMAKVAAVRAEKRLFDTQLASPISGILVRRNVDPGQVMLAGTTAFTVVDLDAVRVRVAVPEANIQSVMPGASASVIVPALGNAKFNGRVKSVSAAADPATHSFDVDIAIANPAHKLRAGMTAQATIDPSARTRRSTSAVAATRAGAGVRRIRRAYEPIVITGVVPAEPDSSTPRRAP